MVPRSLLRKASSQDHEHQREGSGCSQKQPLAWRGRKAGRRGSPKRRRQWDWNRNAKVWRRRSATGWSSSRWRSYWVWNRWRWVRDVTSFLRRLERTVFRATLVRLLTILVLLHQHLHHLHVLWRHADHVLVWLRAHIPRLSRLQVAGPSLLPTQLSLWRVNPALRSVTNEVGYFHSLTYGLFHVFEQANAYSA